MSALAGNLEGLHGEEERLRAESAKLIDANEHLAAHMRLVQEAMNVFYALTKGHSHQADDELTIQMLGIRLFNGASSAVKLGMSGYYQTALDQVRDIIETSFLLDYFRTNPDKITIWKNADRRQRQDQFGPVKIRMALDDRDGFEQRKREEMYRLFSEHASHATYRGFRMTTKDNLGEIGPFLNAEILQALVEELAKHFSYAAVVYRTHFPNASLELMSVCAKYDQIVNEWARKYLRGEDVVAK